MSYRIMRFDSAAEDINNLTYTDYYYRLSLIAKSVFKWKNLPNHIDEKWIEKFLFEEGSCLFFKHPTKGLMVAKCNVSGKLNYYDEPTKIRPYGSTFTGKTYENNVNCVLIRNNDDMLPTKRTVKLYAYRLTEITRTIDVNVNNQKTPIVVVCPEKQMLSFKRAMKKVEKNEPVIYGDKSMDIEGIKVLRTDAPVVFPQLQVQKHAIWNECMTFLGVNNANQEKKERLVESEVNANDDQIEMAAAVMLKAREKACELINEMFDLNISVEMRIDDVKEIIEQEEVIE